MEKIHQGCNVCTYVVELEVGDGFSGYEKKTYLEYSQPFNWPEISHQWQGGENNFDDAFHRLN